MSNFFSKLDGVYSKWNDEAYKYLLFLYYLNPIAKVIYLFFMGFLAGLSLPPVNIVIFLPFVFLTVIRMTDFTESIKQAWFVGFWFCLGFFFTGFYWVAFAVLHDKSLIWLFPFALFGIPLVLAVYTACLFPIYLKVMEFSSAIKKIFFFSALWVLFEFGRLYIFQFPWNFIGYSFTFSLSILQSTAVFGILGLSLVVILWASSFHLLLLTGDKNDFIKYFKLILGTNILLLLIYIFGFAKISTYKTEFEDLKIRIVQGKTDPSSSFEKGFDAGFERYLRVTTSENLENINLIIWPEGSFSMPILSDENAVKRISQILTGEQILATGSLRIEGGFKDFQIFNSMVFINKLRGSSSYDKTHLVPFGEFIPFKSLIPMKAVVSNLQDFTRGNGIKSIVISSAVPPFSPLICYEIAFTGSAVKRSEIRSRWILNITNDIWYGRSSGPFQHLEIARVRGIEEGLPVVRATNSGISAVFDEVGNMLFKTRLTKEDVLDFNLPKQKNHRTFFSMVGNIPILIILIIFIAITIIDYIYMKNDKKINEIGYKIKSKNAQEDKARR